jgi:hypothetical protein
MNLQTFLTSETEESRQIHAPAALPRVKNIRYPLNSMLGGPQSRSEHSGEENKAFLSGIEPKSSSST